MAAARKVVIEFLGKDAGLGREAQLVGTRMDRLGGRMKKVGLIAAAGLAAGVALAGKALFDAGKRAAEDEVSQKNLARQLKASAGATRGQIKSTEDWISAQGRAKGITDDELRPALVNLVSATHDVGKAQKLASLAMDVSAAKGLDLGAVSKGLARAQNGNVAGLSRLGVATKDAAGHTLSFQKIQENLTKQFGGAATTKANTFAGKMQRLKVVMDETKEAIGYKLLPVVTKFATWFLNDGIPAISKFSDTMKRTLGPAIQWVRGLFAGGLGGGDSETLKNLQSIVQSFKSFFATLKSLWAAFGPTIVATVQAAFGPIKQIISGQLGFITGIFKAFTALLHGDWAGVWAGLKQAAVGFFTSLKGIVGLGLAVVKGVFQAAGIALKGIFSGIWAGLKNIVHAGASAIVAGVRAIPGQLGKLGGAFANAGKSLIHQFVAGMRNASGIISGIAGNVWSAVKRLLNGAISKINGALNFTIGLPGPDLHVHAGRIPHLAQGGVVSKRPGGTLAVIGEGKYDEAVVPLKPGMRGGGGDTYVINISGVVGDKDALFRYIQQGLLKRQRTTGVALGLG